MRVGVPRLGGHRCAQGADRAVELALMPVNDAHQVVRLWPGFDRQRALELGECLRQPIGAPEDEREVVARQRVARCQFERPPEALDRLLDVLFGLCEPQREVAIRILW